MYHSLLPRIPMFQLNAYNDAQVQESFNRWFCDERMRAHTQLILRSNSSFREIARLPLISTLISLTLEANSEDLTRIWSQTINCRDIINKLIDSVPLNIAPVDVGPIRRNTVAALAELSFASILDNKYFSEYPFDRVMRFLNDALPSDGATEICSCETAFKLGMESGILVQYSGDSVAFRHSIFEQYLAGAYLGGIINRGHGWDTAFSELLPDITMRQFVDEAVWDPRWLEPLRFLAGSLHRADDHVEFLNIIAAENKSDLLETRLAFAASCLTEILS